MFDIKVYVNIKMRQSLTFQILDVPLLMYKVPIEPFNKKEIDYIFDYLGSTLTYSISHVENSHNSTEISVLNALSDFLLSLKSGPTTNNEVNRLSHIILSELTKSNREITSLFNRYLVGVHPSDIVLNVEFRKGSRYYDYEKPLGIDTGVPMFNSQIYEKIHKYPATPNECYKKTNKLLLLLKY